MSWNSPYQTAAFHRALQSAGLPSEAIPVAKGYCYAGSWAGGPLTAWELTVPYVPLQAPGLTAYVFNGIGTKPDDPDAYYTPVIPLQSGYRAQFSGSCRRNIKKAAAHGLYIQQIVAEEDAGTITPLLGHFFGNAENRSFLSAGAFMALVNQGLIHGCAELFVVHAPEARNLCMAVVLVSDTVANLRFTAYDKAGQALRPMNHLISSLCSHYSEKGFAFLDLSGYSMTSGDSRMEGINQFKLSFTSLIAAFKRYT